MEEKLAEALDKIIRWLESGEAFVVEQAPLVAQEYVRWIIVTNIVECALSLFSWIVLVLLIHWLARFEDDEPEEMKAILTSIATVLVLVPFAVNLLQLVKALTAPRVVVLEKVASLL